MLKNESKLRKGRRQNDQNITNPNNYIKGKAGFRNRGEATNNADRKGQGRVVGRAKIQIQQNFGKGSTDDSVPGGKEKGGRVKEDPNHFRATVTGRNWENVRRGGLRRTGIGRRLSSEKKRHLNCYLAEAGRTRRRETSINNSWHHIEPGTQASLSKKNLRGSRLPQGSIEPTTSRGPHLESGPNPRHGARTCREGTTKKKSKVSYFFCWPRMGVPRT